jgi:monoamine oxidase
VKRRQAIRHLGVGISTAAVGASWLASCKKDDPAPEIQYDGTVIVIGAGPAGLYAADILITKGVNVVLLEASDQIGGRVRSLRNQEDLPYQSIADFPVELGAEYWQGSDSIMGEIVANLNLNTVELTEESRKYILGDQVNSAAEWTGNGDFAAVQSFVSGIKTYTGPATSMKDAAGGLSAEAMTLMNSQAGNFYGSSSDRIGIKGISEQMKLVDHELKYYVLKNNTMQDLIISRFDNVYRHVQLNSPVKSLNYTSDPVKITLEDGTEINADKVIITVPVPILKNGIVFSPGLPASKTSALGRLGMDPSMRVILDFKKNFWGNEASFIWGGITGPQYFSGGIGRSEFYQTMSVTINGPKALELSNLNDEEKIVKEILAELDKIYDNQATAFIRMTLPSDNPEVPEEAKMVYYIKDWTKEKYIQGGFSYPLASTTLDDRTALMEPINDRLFFAGEATDISGEPGTINGALASGERVAEDVVLSIKKLS